MNAQVKPTQTGQYPHSKINNDGKIGCLWLFFPTRMHPWVALKYILDIDFFLNICFIIFALSLGWWSSKKTHEYCPWWGCYGHCFTYALFLGVQGIVLGTYVACMSRNTFRWLNDGSLPGKVSVWVWLRTFFYMVQLALFFIQVAGWTTDFDWWEGDRDKIDASKRILIQVDNPVGSVVRVQGSYWNEVNARNWSILMGFSNVLGWMYLLIIGFTAKKAAIKCNGDRDLPLELTRYQPKDPNREEWRLIDKETAVKIHGYNVQQVYGDNGGNASEQVALVNPNVGANSVPMKLSFVNGPGKKVGEADADQYAGQGSHRVGQNEPQVDDGFGWGNGKL